MIRFSKNGTITPWLSNKPKESELKRLTVFQLYTLCIRKKRIKYPFKKTLIDYLMQLDEL